MERGVWMPRLAALFHLVVFSMAMAGNPALFTLDDGGSDEKFFTWFARSCVGRVRWGRRRVIFDRRLVIATLGADRGGGSCGLRLRPDLLRGRRRAVFSVPEGRRDMGPPFPSALRIGAVGCTVLPPPRGN